MSERPTSSDDLARFLGIPEELRDRDQWVVWRMERRRDSKGKEKPTKVPYDPRSSKRADSTDPETWCSFDVAVSAIDRYDGIGFVFAADDPYTGIDLDHCRDPKTGSLEPWAQAIVVQLASYTEVSPSGTGLHTIAKATLPPGRRRKGNIEMYDRARFFCMTGQHLGGSPTTIEDRQTEIQALHARVFGKEKKRPAPPPPTSTQGTVELDDDALLAKARASKNGDRFSRLFDHGDITGYDSQSEADLALCADLAFWTNKDSARMDRLFRRSALFRSKWNERHAGDGRTYGALTIERALDGTGDGFRKASPKESPGRLILLGETVVDQHLAPLHAAPEEHQHLQLNIAAFKLAQLCAAGQIQQESTIAALREAANSLGFKPDEADEAIDGGWQAGLQMPRHGCGKGSTENRLTITVEGGALPGIVAQAEKAMLADSGPQMYQRGGAIVRVVRLERLTVEQGVTRQAGALSIVAVVAPYLVKRFTASADWRKYDIRSGEYKAIDSPQKYAETYLASVGEWKVQPLVGIIEAPTLRPDGSVLQEPGYDQQTGLLFDPGGTVFPRVPVHPSVDEIQAAQELLLDLYKEFPFVSEIDFAAAVTAALTALVRKSLPAAPMFGFSAPKMRIGKTMLGDVASMLATGRPCAVMAQARDEDEEKKRLLAVLMAGDSVICYDNVDREFGGAAISQALTQKTITDRLLGFSRSVTVPTSALFLATGNNLTFQGDITARVVLVNLDPEMERPEERVFSKDLYEYIPKHRGELVAAALTVLRGYQDAGCPKQNVPAWAGFGDWSRMVREAVVWARMPDPAAGRRKAEESDPVRVMLSGLLSAWFEFIGGEHVTASEIVVRTKAELGVIAEPPNRAALRMALLEVAGNRGESIDPRRLGKYLKTHANRIESGCRIERVGERQGAALWRVAKV